ncbi:hypothetical protein CLPUN_01950 [Clostridium puniceum]|uniref:Uncharacterized protein n=1 Tax=Clostridium puniceum TaxID=29367 RepID=A0A1S8TXH6_9CLOT|nr:hypothetical protein CLPUN_01950 [Clostridium puniceum]
MADQKSTKIITVIIYFLIIALISLILYSLFLIINNSYYSIDTPRNSIKVGTISSK